MTAPRRAIHDLGRPLRHGLGAGLLLAVLLSTVDCTNSQESSANQQTAASDPTAVESPPVPSNTDFEGEWLFQLDTTTPVFTAPISGSSTHELHGVLTDTVGRREIRYVSVADGSFDVVAASDWNLPAQAATNGSGQTLACYNRLIGTTTSRLTDGVMPDPTGGVDLLCRMHDGSRWGDVIRLETPFEAAWVSGVEVSDDGGFGITSYEDDGLFVPTTTTNSGLYQRSFDAAGFGIPAFIESALNRLE